MTSAATAAVAPAASLALASRRRKMSLRPRGGASDSISSRAADAAIESFRQSRRQRNVAGGEPEVDAVTDGIKSLAANVSATAEAQGVPRWVLLTAVLGVVSLLAAVAVSRTLPLFARHAASGAATIDGKPLGRVSLGFHKLTFSSSGEPQATEVASVRTDPDGAFQIDRVTGLSPGLYAVAVRPGESLAKIPEAYRTGESTPLRFEIREDLQGMQLGVRTGAPIVRKPRR